jgi:hypothetical protein
MRLLSVPPLGPAVLAACVLLTACATPHGAPGQYEQSLDTHSNFCAKYPARCHPQAVGPMATAQSPLSGPQATALGIAAAAKVVQIAIDATLDERIRKALKECADQARSEVMYRHFQRGPTRDECLEVVESDAQGQPVTRAMLLGREQHKAALQCAQHRLKALKPGGFTLSPRYRFDPDTGQTHFMPSDQVKTLLDQGRSAELLGPNEPDIVVHLPGQPLGVQLVFDFKFPCVNTDTRSAWRRYPQGHPFKGLSQGELYKIVLKVEPFLVQPHVGVFR